MLLSELKLLYIGVKCNNLTVTDVVKHSDKKESNRGYFFQYICVCGNTGLARKQRILKNITKSCGCIRNKFGHTKSILPNNESAFNIIFSRYVHGAKTRSLGFELSKEEFKALINQNCHYCNVSPQTKVTSKSSSILVNGVDRKNNHIGYTKENCVSCCSTCNRIKHVLSYDVFVNHMYKILKNLDKI